MHQFRAPDTILDDVSFDNKETITYYGPSATDSVVATKNFYYNNSNHAQLTRIVETNSDGAKRLTSLKYPLDYTNAPTSVEVATIDSLKNKHMHNAVLQKGVRQQKSGQTDSSVYPDFDSRRIKNNRQTPMNPIATAPCVDGVV